jgi:iron complex outermembrane receptor protein
MRRQLLCIFCVISFSLFGQTKKDVGGVILDELGQPLPGASIVEKGNATNGVLSDFDGEFVISVKEETNELEVSFLGYETKVVTITGSNLTIKLEAKADQLDAVIVQGFASVATKARLRTQAIQDLPETTVALGSAEIEASGIQDIQDFTSQISNVTFTQAQQPGVNFLTVRGISQIRNAESPVAVVIDGMTLPDASAMNMSLYDIELMEFIKGPQGTLYGKNAIAGAVNIITKDPTNVNKTKATITTGNGGLFRGGLSSSGAFVDNKFYYSVTGRYSTFDGLIDNTFLNQKVDFSDEINFRGKLKYKFSPRWSATFVQDNFDIQAGGNYYITKTDIFDPTIPPLQDDDYSNDVFGDVLGDSDLSNSLSSLKVEGKLKNMNIQSVTSYNATRRWYIGENDYSQYAFSKVSQTSDSDTFSQEIRVTSNTDENSNFDYTFGTLYQNSQRYLNTSTFLNETYYEGGFTDPSAENANYSEDPLVGNDDDNTIETLAGFGFLDYRVTSKLTLSAGVRIDYDRLKNESRISNSTLENDITVWQPKFSIAYKFTDDILAYANYGRGYRSGGFNSEETVKFGKTYDPEFTNNYELGIKTSFLNNRIIFNNAVYYIEFENQQQYTFIPLTPSVLGIYNFDKTEIRGFESEIKFKATNNIDFFASIGINDGKILEGTYNRLTNAANFDYETFEVVDVSGNASPFTVENTIQIGANGNFDLGKTSKIGIYINVDHRGTQFWDPLEEYKQDPYTLLNGRINLKFDKIGVSLWANNILNTEYNPEFFPTAEFGFSNIRFPHTPTTFGVDLSYNF